MQSRPRLSGGFIWVWLCLSDSRGEEGRTLRHADSGNGPGNHFISLVVIPQSAKDEIAWIMLVSVRGGSVARVDVCPTDGEPAPIESNGNLQEWLFTVQNISPCGARSSSVLCQVRGKWPWWCHHCIIRVLPAQHWIIYLFRTIRHALLNYFIISIAGNKGFLCGCAISFNQNLLGYSI